VPALRCDALVNQFRAASRKHSQPTQRDRTTSFRKQEERERERERETERDRERERERERERV